MLTLKHVIWDGGFETLYEAKQVRTKREELKDAPSSWGSPEFVAFDDETGVRQITNGIVCVMNEHGKTVAKYDLRKGPVAQEQPPPPDTVAASV